MISRYFSVFVLSVAVAVAGPVAADELSGTFVGSGGNGAYLIDMVRLADGSITGRYEQVILQPSGQLADTNAAVTGASDGQTVILTIKANAAFSRPLSVSGTLDGQVLRLSGGAGRGSFDMELTKGSDAAFQGAVATLNDQAGQIRQAQADAKFAMNIAEALAELQRLTQRADAFGPYADAHFSKFGLAEQKYRTITAAMEKGLAKQKSKIGDGDAQVARYDVSVWIGDAEITASGIHDRVEAAQTDFERTAHSILSEFPRYQQACAELAAVGAGQNQGIDLASWQLACADFRQSATAFQDRVASLKHSFENIAATWADENERQLAIVRASTAAR